MFFNKTWDPDSGFYISDDGGVTWHRAGPAAAFAGSGYRILVDPRDRNLIYVGNSRSTDGGLTWTPLRFAPAALNATNPDIMYSGMGVNWVFKSKDRGVCWKPFSGTFGNITGIRANAFSSILVEMYPQSSGLPPNSAIGGIWRTVDTDLITAPVFDTSPPALSASASPATIWPPDGSMVGVVIRAVASDAETCVTSLTINGSPVSIDDPYIQVFLRATERTTYTIPVVATDAAGNQSRVDVVIPVALGR